MLSRLCSRRRNIHGCPPLVDVSLVGGVLASPGVLVPWVAAPAPAVVAADAGGEVTLVRAIVRRHEVQALAVRSSVTPFTSFTVANAKLGGALAPALASSLVVRHL